MRHKRVSHLNRAVEHFQLVLDRCSVDHPDHAAALTNLAWARIQGYIQNDLQDIDTTTSLFREALALRPQGHPNHTLSLFHLIAALNWRYGKERTAEYVNLPIDASDEGIQLRRVVLELCPVGLKYRPRALDRLAQSLLTRFEQRGSIDDLEESIQLRREAVSLCPEGHSDRGDYLNNLAVSLESRFEHQGKSHDLDEVISMHEEALRMRPVGHKCRDFSLDNLGSALRTRFRKHGDVDDINRAVSLYREALMLCPPGHPGRGITLNNLALTLKERYDKSQVIENLNEAIDLYRECLRIKLLDDDLKHHRTLFNLSAVLCSRFTRTRQNEDVEEAIRLCQESLVILPLLHPDRHFSLLWLQEAYLSRYQVQHNPTDLSLAVENYRLASRHPTHGLPQRILVSYDWTATAEQHGDGSVLEAYSTFFELLDAHLGMRSSTTSRREAATDFHFARSLPVDAASCAIRSDNLRRAAELAEQGRGQQWSLASRLKTPIEELESGHPHLARKFSELSKRVSNAAQGSAAITDRAAADRAATELASGSSQWPDDFATAIRHTARMRPEEPRKKLRVLLRIVWDEIMLPIVNVLQHDLKLQHRSRIWLCPTAAFTSIPLHAANPFRMNADRSGSESCLEDLYICSYTPTLSALIRARQAMKTRATPSFAAIGQSQPGAGQGDVLPAVDSELELVHTLVPPNIKFTNISKDEATQAGALNALQCNTWVHLACHGKQDLEQPYNSYFAMRDKPITLLDIMEKDIPHAEFAFLSACHTAVGDEEMPDEAIHLAAGLQFSGFKSVVGTLWGVSDALAKHVVEAFYEKMFEDLEDGVIDCTKAAWALNRATNAVKTKVPLEQRMVFIHIGV
ncbi:CHAT domain-containing protein [Suillus clintonianus]|uniref:CHAT domain-containing protein n=1 Tax=Suillus clintonianus TaxID=1904413 RepID=UPI001B86CE30|nr:CHAT domain-containing protein [Suillus clintonianus]KAG2123289.1 CHAT domain-containing protein [Suillus clintonianus]